LQWQLASASLALLLAPHLLRLSEGFLYQYNRIPEICTLDGSRIHTA
jgi:hypothetical protein